MNPSKDTNYEKRKRKQIRKMKHIMAWIVVVVIGAGVVAGIGAAFYCVINSDNSSNQVLAADEQKTTKATEYKDGKENKPSSTDKPKEVVDPEMQFMKEQANKILNESKELLVLVNKNHKYNPTEPFEMCKLSNKRLQAAEILNSDLNAMFDAAEKEGHLMWIASAYRSRERQQSLIDADIVSYMREGMDEVTATKEALKLRMPAGYSEHETGLALDIIAYSNTTMDNSQEDTPENKWLRQHCDEYGFILRYPKDKEEVTRITYEPWHFRYVGKEAAKFMKEHNLSLEELYQLAS